MGYFGSDEAMHGKKNARARMNYAHTEECASPNVDLWRGKGKNLLRRICGGEALPFSGRDQVDVAAKLDEDEGRSGDGGGAPVADGGGRKKMRNRE